MPANRKELTQINPCTCKTSQNSFPPSPLAGPQAGQISEVQMLHFQQFKLPNLSDIREWKSLEYVVFMGEV